MIRLFKVAFFFIFFTTLFSVLFTDKLVYAQSAISCWITKIGSPTTEKPSLPAECLSSGTSGGTGNGDQGAPVGASCPGAGEIICSTLKQGCHCSDAYIADLRSRGMEPTWCFPAPQSADWAIDIVNPLHGPVIIPKIYRPESKQAHSLTCVGYCYDSQNCDIQGTFDSNQIIQTVSCKDDVTGDAVWLHFHHSDRSMPTIGNKQYKSGDQIGISAPQDLPHVHLQMGIGGPCESADQGFGSCVEPYLYVQCGGS